MLFGLEFTQSDPLVDLDIKDEIGEDVVMTSANVDCDVDEYDELWSKIQSPKRKNNQNLKNVINFYFNIAFSFHSRLYIFYINVYIKQLYIIFEICFNQPFMV